MIIFKKNSGRTNVMSKVKLKKKQYIITRVIENIVNISIVALSELGLHSCNYNK